MTTVTHRFPPRTSAPSMGCPCLYIAVQNHGGHDRGCLVITTRMPEGMVGPTPELTTQKPSLNEQHVYIIPLAILLAPVPGSLLRAARCEEGTTVCTKYSRHHSVNGRMMKHHVH